jgi:hypothetical protein
MAVTVDLAKLKRQRSEFGDGVIVLLAGCENPDAVEIISEEADFGFASGEFEGESPMKAGVAPSVDGPVFILEPAPRQLWDWIGELALRLERRGLSGTLTAAKPARPDDWLNTPTDTSWLGASVLYPGWRGGRPRWAWDDPVGEDVPRMAAEWCRQDAEKVFVWSGIFTQVRPAELPDVLAMVTKHDGLVLAHAATTAPFRMRGISFSQRGFAGCVVNSNQTLATQVELVSGLLSWHPELMSYAFVRRFPGNADPQSLDPHELPVHPTTWSSWRVTHLIDRLVLDAHAIQLLTTKHLERANNLDAWTVSEVAPDRYLVTAPDIEPWLAGPTPDRNTLIQARRDFGAMIATAERIKELNQIPA